jgi:hypothetical protein
VIGRVALGWRRLPSWVLEDRGVTVDAEGLVRLPYRLADGSLYAHRVVAPSGRRWWEPGDGRAVIPFGIDRLELPRFRQYRGLAVTEGESDALALAAAFGDRLDVLGCPGAWTWRQEWARHAEGYAVVYVVGDGDAAGRSFTSSVVADVPGAFAVWLPAGSDARSIVHAEPARLVDLLAEAEALREFLTAAPSRLGRAA